MIKPAVGRDEIPAPQTADPISMEFSVTDFGALGDGRTVNTAAIQAAIDACASARGGTVVIPAGVYVSGSIMMKSNVTLRFQPGAILKGSRNLSDYPAIAFAHNEFDVVRSLIWAIECSNIRLSGDGIIDLSGSAFMDWGKTSPGIKIRKEAVFTEQQQECLVVTALDRPTQCLFFRDCDRIMVDGIHVTDAPCWTFSMSLCRNVKVHNVTIESRLNVPNGDGIHLSACTDVIISDSNFSCGDDCVAITCVTDWNIPSERIIISNCIMRSRSSAVRIGYWQSQVRNVIVSNLIIHDSNRGIGIFAGENGRVADVQISNIISETRLVPGAWWGHGEPLAMLATHARGYIHGISVSGIRAVSESGLIIYSEQSGNVSDISINNCAISLRQGRDRDIFLPVYDTQPADLISAPDPLVHLPWLTAIKATGLSLQNIRATYAADERPAYKIDALIENCSDCRQTNVLVEESDAVS